MIILLPNKPDGLAALEKKLEKYDLADIPARMRSRKVSLSLPKFRLESTIDLTGILSEVSTSYREMLRQQAERKYFSWLFRFFLDGNGIHVSGQRRFQRDPL